ncbi:hypothetical protein LH452_15225 [Laribacter hongkongensis]|uniref:hypothetical protein n=1 Tax=Laribacter hongkongensis TaxID=168471 RepID=UPI001EFDBFFA|nr:hypothetical protein [Laribacter hongkongensis]MCG9060232.1 hypothetical protein [Laribacter hongkongensis]MCG9087329.1 hypothetical protein [Laribacter hongkongensis]
MNYLDQIKEIYDFEVRCFNFLTEIGFSKRKPRYIDEGFDEVEYASENFVFTIGMHAGRDENYRRFKDAKNSSNLIYPTAALDFFLPDYESERVEIAQTISEENAAKKATLIEVNLYKRHPWVLKSPEWVSHPDLVLAVNKANEWLWAQKDLVGAQGDYSRVLHSFKNKSYVFDADKL